MLRPETESVGEGASAAPSRRAAFGFIFVSAVTSAMSIGIMVPILPNLLKQFVGGDTAAASEWNVVFASCGGVMSFFAGPVLGLLADRLGRRPVLLVSLSGLGLDFLFMAFAPSLAWLFVGRLISGATSGVFSTANAYVADVTAPADRARAFGWMGAAFNVGFLAGPAIGGLLGQVNLRLPFMAAAALTLANALYGALILPESLPPERRAARFTLARANPVGSLGLLRSRPGLGGLAGVYFLNQLATMVWPSVFVLYTGYRYGWTPGVVGMTMMVGGVMGVAVQSFLVGPTIRRFGETGAMLAGAAAGAAGLAWYGLAPTSLSYWLGMPISCLGGLLIPGLQGLMTRRVGPHEQGQLQGANQSLAGLASVIGPILFGLSFAWAVRHPAAHLPGLPLLLGAAAMLVCLVLGLRLGRARPPAKSSYSREAGVTGSLGICDACSLPATCVSLHSGQFWRSLSSLEILPISAAPDFGANSSGSGRYLEAVVLDEYTQVRAARVRSVYERLTGASLITVINGALMAAVLEWRVRSPWPWLWLGLVVVLAAGRVASGHAYRSDPRPSDRLPRWEAIAVAGSLLSGALWGVGSTWLYPADEMGQWIWVFLIAGMCAGAVTLHAAHAPTAMAYIVPAGAPLALRLAIAGRAPQLAASAMIVVFLIASGFTVLRFSRQFGRLFTLQLDLEQRTQDLDEANARLRAEIEHHKSTEAILRQAQKLEALGQITGGIAHDFNNLLTVISGNLDLIGRRAPDNEVILRLATAASHAARRGAELTGSLLSFARKQALHPELIDVNAAIREFTQLLRRAGGENVTLELDLAAAPSTSYADAAHFQSALLNLVINARDAMPGGGRVLISTHNVTLDDTDPAIVVRVSDGGTGMAPDVATRAFEPFFTTKDVGKGSGLGLSQVYGFARQTGGYAGIESKPGEGTSVSMVLPAQMSDTGDSASPDIFPPRVVATDGPVRVLLVEDDLEVLSTLREQMLLSGWSVVTAQDGQTALALLGADPAITILVSDVMMPGGLTGIELARAAARARPGLPILLISGYPDAALADHGADLREFELLHKPFTHQELIERVLNGVAAQEGGAAPLQISG